MIAGNLAPCGRACPLPRLGAPAEAERGAARFGRRTLGPHARPAAPLLPHEANRHEAVVLDGTDLGANAPEFPSEGSLTLRQALLTCVPPALRRRREIATLEFAIAKDCKARSDFFWADKTRDPPFNLLFSVRPGRS
jgi:hypothetical protein